MNAISEEQKWEESVEFGAKNYRQEAKAGWDERWEGWMLKASRVQTWLEKALSVTQ